MSTKEAQLSLLSLSLAAASAQPIPVDDPSGEDPDALSVGSVSVGSPHSLGLGNLSLGSSSSPPSMNSRAKVTQIGFSVEGAASEDGTEGTSPPPGRVFVAPIPIGKTGKKRGMDHKCESCDKIYRHPSCLIKHRWEHTPHWRESSKYVLSKHQQVQLLEAAAILSHLNQDTAQSLPDDRSLWPSFLSGGSLPKQHEGAGSGVDIADGVTSTPHPPYQYPDGRASSVPPTSFLGATAHPTKGPSAKTFELPRGAVEVRPGVVGVAHPTQSLPISASVPVSTTNSGTRKHRSSRSLSGRDEALGVGLPSESIPLPVPASAGSGRYGTRGYYRRSGSVLSSSALSTSAVSSVLSTSSVAEEDDGDMDEAEDDDEIEVDVDVETEPPLGIVHSASVPSITYSSSRSRSRSRSLSPMSDSDIEPEMRESQATIHTYDRDEYVSPSYSSYGKESSVRGGAATAPASNWDEEMEMDMD